MTSLISTNKQNLLIEQGNFVTVEKNILPILYG